GGQHRSYYTPVCRLILLGIPVFGHLFVSALRCCRRCRFFRLPELLSPLFYSFAYMVFSIIVFFHCIFILMLDQQPRVLFPSVLQFYEREFASQSLSMQHHLQVTPLSAI